MIASAAWLVLKYLAIAALVIFILYHLFTDPVGSAEWVSSVVGGIIDGIKALITFATSVHT